MRALPRPVKYLLITLLAPLLSACSDPDSAEALLSDYSGRVSNALDQPIELTLDQREKVPLLPERKARRLETTELREGLLDVLNLKACDLLPLIAQRNSSLGKVMPASQQLAYEIRFYTRLRDCRTLLRQQADTDPELLEQVELIYKTKHADLPRHIWNGIYLAQEMEDNFSRGDKPLPAHGWEYSATDESMRFFEQASLLAVDPEHATLPAGLDTLERHYQALYSNRFGSEWLAGIMMLTETLNSVAGGIEERLARRPVCPLGTATRQADILWNVFNRYYAQGVQPYMAKLNQTGERWRQQHLLLSHRLPTPPAMQDYFSALFATGQASLWQNYIDARNRHTQAWQELLGQCSMMPSR